ncbi:MAG: hypothetical protein IT305_30605 [Chloroflexi bacterium]|nr:hypothetical protein [Chloroflexota bacterium]
MFAFIMLVGSVFGLIGALIAGLITYQEYTHHFPDRAPAARAGVATGIVTLAFFLVMSVVIGAVLDRLIGG